jgi:hypothetical protein
VSYLSATRLHFAGQFQASVSTINNVPQNFDLSAPAVDPVWNPDGDGDWRLAGCRVTSAYAEGSPAAAGDPVLTCLIADADARPPAKLVDLDPEAQMVSMIWGLEVRICAADGTTLVRGEFEPAPFIDIWMRTMQGGAKGSDQPLGAQYQSVLTAVDWGDVSPSPMLTALRDATGTGLLSIKFNVDGYNQTAGTDDFTRGRIVGTLGPASDAEPRHFVLGRHLLGQPASGSWVNAPQLNYCTAVVDDSAGNVLVDLGNAIGTTVPGGPLIDVGVLPVRCGSVALGDVPASHEGWYHQTAGIFALPADRRLTAEELQILAGAPLTIGDSAGAGAISEAPDGGYVRADQFVFRLDPGETAPVQLFSTRFGRPAPATVAVTAETQGSGPKDAPVGLSFPPTLEIGASGTALLPIQGRDPGHQRRWIDGQVYAVSYDLQGPAPQNPADKISVLVFDMFSAGEPPSWMGGLKQVFEQYDRLYPVMRRFLQLSDYESVAANRELLRLAFSRDISDPNSMPVTRDLSGDKRRAILRWLTEVGTDRKPLFGTANAAARTLAEDPAAAPQEPPDMPIGGKMAAMERRRRTGRGG